MSPTISFEAVTKNGAVKNLSGKQRGIDARRAFNLDLMDNINDKVIIEIPSYIYSISTSFFLGLFSDSFCKFRDAHNFLNHYEFKATPEIMNQVMHSVGRCLMKKPSIDL